MNTKNYAIVIERGECGGYGAYIPDLPGCVAAGGSEDEVRERLRGALAMHLKAMMEDGDAIPEPTTVVEYVALAS